MPESISMASMPHSAHRPAWHSLSDDTQLTLARQALHHAFEVIAGQAEGLAGEIDDGALADRGGAEALRLLVAVVRAAGGTLGSGTPTLLQHSAVMGRA